VLGRALRLGFNRGLRGLLLARRAATRRLFAGLLFAGLLFARGRSLRLDRLLTALGCWLLGLRALVCGLRRLARGFSGLQRRARRLRGLVLPWHCWGRRLRRFARLRGLLNFCGLRGLVCAFACFRLSRARRLFGLTGLGLRRIRLAGLALLRLALVRRWLRGPVLRSAPADLACHFLPVLLEGSSLSSRPSLASSRPSSSSLSGRPSSVRRKLDCELSPRLRSFSPWLRSLPICSDCAGSHRSARAEA
jgi:hypothetical protein